MTQEARVVPELRSLLPGGVVGFDSSSALPLSPLYAAEEAYLERAVDKRKQEFAWGRTFARRALTALGAQAEALVPLADRSVPWPQGVVGTITHAEGYVAALAARASELRGIGLDAEVRGRVEERLWKQIATETETAWLRSFATQAERVERATLLFSAKEAFYKAQYCVSRAWVGFKDVELTADETGQFVITLSKNIAGLAARGTRFTGRYTHTSQHVLTTCFIEPGYDAG